MTEEDRIVEEVRKHYSLPGARPFLLSDLGIFIRKAGLRLPDNVPLKNYLGTNFAGKLEVVQDPTIPARIAVALPENGSEIRERLSGPGATSLRKTDVDGLAFPLIVAFCVPVRPGQKLYFRRVPPFRYEFSDHPLGSEYIEIQDEYRPADIVGTQAGNLTPDQKGRLFEVIKKWATAKSIDWQDFLTKHAAPHAAAGCAHQNALERLVAAQPPELRRRINIPLDIAATLMRQP